MRDLAIIPDGALLLRDGVIEEVGPTRASRESGGCAWRHGDRCHRQSGDARLRRRAHPFDVSAASLRETWIPTTASIPTRSRALVSITAQRVAARGRAWLNTMACMAPPLWKPKPAAAQTTAPNSKCSGAPGVESSGALDIVPTFCFALGHCGGCRARLRRLSLLTPPPPPGALCRSPMGLRYDAPSAAGAFPGNSSQLGHAN